MKITCAKEDLLNAVNIVSRAVSSKTTHPILECILLTANEQGFKLLANNTELAIETESIDARIDEYGTVALEAKMFSEIIRKLPDVDVCIYSDELNVSKITSGKSEFKFLGQVGDEFPTIPLVEKNSSFAVSSLTLKNIIRQTIFSVATEETRPILMGELFEIGGGKLNLAAVDGYRVSVRTIDMPEEEERKIVIPAKTLSEISRILPQEDTNVTLYFSNRHVLFELENCKVVSRLLEGDFLRYNQAFMTDSKIIAKMLRRDIVDCLERATLMAREAKKSPVNVKIEANTLTINAQTEMGVFNEEIQLLNNCDELEISFNPKYLIDILKVIESDEIELKFSTNLSPCIISGDDGTAYKYLVLPLRLRN